MNKLTSVLVILMLLVASTAMAGVSTRQTNLPVVDSGKDIYGKPSSGAAKQLVGINSAGQVSIDESEVGIVINGAFMLDDVQAVSVNASATTNVTGSTLLVYNGATVGTANIVLPASPSNGQAVSIVAKPAITVATVTGGTKTVNGGSTSFSANTAVGYIYSSTTGQWHKYK